jgi:DNA repair protein RecO (recombination protein O)
MDSARQRLYRVEGIVVRRLDVGEADKILTLYTAQRGKLRVMAKGVRRPESHLGGNVELFVRTRALIARGRNLDIITQAETVDAYKGLRVEHTDPVRLHTAFYICELIDALTAEDLPNEAIYTLLYEALAALAGGGEADLVARYVEFRLLTLSGYRLEVARCVHCRAPLQPVASHLSLDQGGVLCPDCTPTDPGARPLSVNALKVLRLMAREPLAGLLRFALSGALRAELESLGHASIRQQVEHEPRSWVLLAAVTRAAAETGAR